MNECDTLHWRFFFCKGGGRLMCVCADDVGRDSSEFFQGAMEPWECGIELGSCSCSVRCERIFSSP